jgi:hypothetical protein
MPRFLFYAGTGFCLFLALSAAAGFAVQLDGGTMSFIAVRGAGVTASAAAAWGIVVALLAGMAVAAIFVRMAALLAARNLFGAFVALLSITAAMLTLAWTLLLQSRMVMLARQGAAVDGVAQLHFAAVLMLGCFVSITFLALRPYFSVQASRALAALVFFPFPLYCLILIQELFVSTPLQALPPATPASVVFFALVALLFFAIAVHCIRHRHIFLEMTNLRELLDSRAHRGVGGMAFDS